MSYHIYTTKGIVLSARGVGEADRIYTLFTRDLGKIHAKATGVRKENSKLRGNLEPYSLSSISFVKGKDLWRITSAELIKNIPALQAFAKPLSLLNQLVQGEESNLKLFDDIEQAVLSEKNSEVDLAAKILYHLGYLNESDLNLSKKALIQAINRGLQASHLT